MKKIFKKSMIALMVVLFSATLAMADGRDRDRDKDQDRDCWTQVIKHDTNALIAKDQTRDRKKDGSCDNDCTCPCCS